MSRGKRKYTALENTQARLDHAEQELAFFRDAIRTEKSLDRKRILWCRIEETKDKIITLKAKARRLRHRRKPTPPQPLFTYNNKEI